MDAFWEGSREPSAMPLETPTHVGLILALVPGMVWTPAIPDSSNYAYLNTLGVQELLAR